MSDQSSSFVVQLLIRIVVIAGIIGLAWWVFRRDREKFHVIQVLGVVLLAALGSVPFVAAFWWLAPRDWGGRNPYLLAALFVPLFSLELWGLVRFGRKAREKRRTKS